MLGVRYVLEGSVRKAGSRVRITAQLIDALSGMHLWADRFDGSFEGVFGLQDKVASSVAGVIEPALQAAETTRSGSRPPDDLTAYELPMTRRPAADMCRLDRAGWQRRFEIAGPARAPFDEIVARYLKAVGDPREVVRDREARSWGGRVEEFSLVPLGGTRLGRIGLDEWLRRSQTKA